jgi:flagellar basal-body rod modification protein FlgD
MTEIGTSLGVPGTGGGDVEASKKKLGDTFDNFLTLLTTQLQNQDPLSPMDSNQFTEQLVHFTNVEQSIAQTEKLEELLALSGFNQTAQAVGFIGKQVETEGSFLQLDGPGGASMTYDLPSATRETRIAIVSPDGRLVRTLPGQTTAGSHTLAWDGKDSQGNALADGVYEVFVTAMDRDNVTVEADTRSLGRVTGVRTEGGQTLLDIGGAEIPLDQVLAIRDGQRNDTSEGGSTAVN